MEKRILLAVLVASVSCALNAGYEQVSEYGQMVTTPSASRYYTGKIAPETPVGQAAEGQLQKIEAAGQERLQATQPMQRVQQMKTQVQQPTSAVTSRFGGGKFF